MNAHSYSLQNSLLFHKKQCGIFVRIITIYRPVSGGVKLFIYCFHNQPTTNLQPKPNPYIWLSCCYHNQGLTFWTECNNTILQSFNGTTKQSCNLVYLNHAIMHSCSYISTHHAHIQSYTQLFDELGSSLA
jgi:hypothetical protein